MSSATVRGAETITPQEGSSGRHRRPACIPSSYDKKFVSAEQALRLVKSGDRVVLGHACGEPPALVEALVARAPELRDVEIVHMVAMGPAKFAQPGMEQSFRFNGFFVGAPTRQAVQDGRGSYTP